MAVWANLKQKSSKLSSLSHSSTGNTPTAMKHRESKACGSYFFVITKPLEVVNSACHLIVKP